MAGSETQSYKSQEAPTEITPPVLEMTGVLTLAPNGVDQLTNQAVSERNRTTTFGSHQIATKESKTAFYATTGSGSGVTKEAGTVTGGPVTHTEETNSSLVYSNNLPLTASFSSPLAGEMEATNTLLPNITVQNSTIPLTLPSLPSLKDSEMERKVAKVNLWHPSPLTVPETKDSALNLKTTTTATHSTNHSFNYTNPPRSTSHKQRGPIQDQTPSLKFETQSSSAEPWGTSANESQMSPSQDKMRPTQKLHLKPLLHSQTSSPKPFLQIKTSPFKPSLQFQRDRSQTFPFSQASQSSMPFPKSEALSPNVILPSESPTVQPFLKSHTTSSLTQDQPLSLQYPLNKLLNVPSHHQPVSNLPKQQRQTSALLPQLQATAPFNSPSQSQSTNSPSQSLHQNIQTQTEGHTSLLQADQSQSDTPRKAFNMIKMIKTMSPIFVSILSTIPPPTGLSTHHSSSLSSTHIFPASSPGSTNPLYSPEGLTLLTLKQMSVTLPSFSSSPSSSAMKNQPKTAPALSALPPSSPISIPPHSPSVQPLLPSPMPSSITSHTIPPQNSTNSPSSAPFFSSVPLSTSSLSSLSSSQSYSSSTFSSPSSTISPAFSSFISTSASSISSSSYTPSPPRSSTSISTSTSISSPLSLGSSSYSIISTTSSLSSSQSTSPHPEPSPALRRSQYQSLTSNPPPVPSQQLTLGQKLLIRSHITSLDSEPNLKLPTPRTVIHPNPKLHQNLNQNFKQNLGHELKPNLPNVDTKPKHPSSPAETPDKEGKYPDIIPRHSAWELGMLLGCSAGLGMVLVIGVRYMYRQACGKQTEVTLNDRERAYGRGERGLIHVQECGDLVRVRRIRDNSFVLLAEYDILATPGD